MKKQTLKPLQKRKGIYAIVKDNGRIEQTSFDGTAEVFRDHDLRLYYESDWENVTGPHEQVATKQAEKYAKQKGWDVVYVTLHRKFC